MCKIKDESFSEKVKGSNSMSEHIKEINDDSFEKEVLQSGKPVLVDFWAEWCHPCRMMLPTVEAVAAEREGSASVVKLNIDQSPATPQRYGVRGIPTMILFKDGKEVDRVVGATSKETLTRMIDKHIGLQAA
jgi:thioredoxin 1